MAEQEKDTNLTEETPEVVEETPVEETASPAEAAPAEQEAASDPAGELKAQLAAKEDQLLRLAAEYDNFRRRSAREKTEAYSKAKADAALAFLPVYDNLERALKQGSEDEAFLKGVEMTMNQLRELLGTMGVTEIAAVGEKFDPAIHNAVLQMESADHEEGMILEELKKGFMLGDKVLRHSDVIVAK